MYDMIAKARNPDQAQSSRLLLLAAAADQAARLWRWGGIHARREIQTL